MSRSCCWGPHCPFQCKRIVSARDLVRMAFEAHKNSFLKSSTFYFLCRRKVRGRDIYRSAALLCFAFTLFNVAVKADTDIPIATQYQAFGPLPLGSRGGDPLNVFGLSVLDLLASLRKFPSETATGGYASWRNAEPYNVSGGGLITVPFADAELPYEAYAIANFSITEDAAHPHLLRCDRPAVIRRQSGDHVISEDSSHDATDVIHCMPDVYNDGRLLCPARLRTGVYEIVVHLESRVNHTSFFCNYFFDPAKQPDLLLLPLNDTVVPSIVVDSGVSPHAAHLAGAHCSITVLNVHDAAWATAGVARINSAVNGLRLLPQSSSDDHYPLPRLAPRQVRQLRLDLTMDSDFLSNVDSLPKSVDFTIIVSYRFPQGDTYTTTFNLTLPVAVWQSDRAYHYTYVDVDGSIQAAAVLPPRHPCTGAPAGDDACPVLLSTHGAGVDAIGSAWTDSYRTQNQSWVLLPTGRRKYGLNWEGPQMNSAIVALRALADTLPGVPPREANNWRPRKDFWLQAGHSMGGHGALLLSTHYPDMLVAALPAMGWLRLDTYVGSCESEDASYSEASLRALLSAASEEYNTDLYSENLLGIPFLARVGSADVVVPPSNLRKFCRLLKENEIFHNMTSVVTLNEVPGEGHWFDGVVDDNELQVFIDKNLGANHKPVLPKEFTVATMNPASMGSRGGLKILSQEVVFELSRLHVKRDSPAEKHWKLHTKNVRRFRYEAISGIKERPERLLIDGDEQGLEIPSTVSEEHGSFIDFCAVSRLELGEGQSNADERPVSWRLCTDERTFGKEKSKERGPDNFGPGFQVLGHRKVMIVFPEGDVLLQDFAIRYSNSLYLRGISALVTTDSNVTAGQLGSRGDVNMILLGGPSMNQIAKMQVNAGFSADVIFNGHGFCIAKQRCFVEPGTGIAFLSGGPSRTLLFYAAGTDRDGMMAAIDWLPYSPASNIPEWVIVKKSRGWGFRGLGGVVALGYWDRKWKLEPRKSYPAEFIFDVKRPGVTCADKRLGQTQVRAWAETASVIAILVAVMLFVTRCIRSRRTYSALATDDYDKEPQSQPTSVDVENGEEVVLITSDSQR